MPILMLVGLIALDILKAMLFGFGFAIGALGAVAVANRIVK